MNPQPLITTTEAVDRAFYFIFGISGLALLGIIVAMVYLVWRYNRKRQPVPLSQKDHNAWLEVTWTIIPTILVMMMFWYGWEGYLSLQRIPDGSVPIKASARMWSWLFTYENGKTSDKLFVPVGQPVQVELIAEDVLHSFYVPAFRVKRDCVPGMTTHAWFVAEEPGSYDLFCAEYCGVGHADMITTVEALSAQDFKEWLTILPTEANAGESLLQKHGCLGCHSLDGSRQVGPTFQGIAGRSVTVVVDGQSQTINTDRAYLEKAILEPNAEIVDTYPPAMPAYEGRISEEELTAILDFLMAQSSAPAVKSAAPEQSSTPTAEEPSTTPQSGEAATPTEETLPTVPDGATLANRNGCLGCHSTDGTDRVGPSLKGLFGQERTIEKDGQEMNVTADHAYLDRAIREPNVEIVRGYPPAMPPYANLSDTEIQAIVDWIKSLDE